MEDYQPQERKRQAIWQRWSASTRTARLASARRLLAAVEAVLQRPNGESEHAAIVRLVPETPPSTVRLWCQRFVAEGFEGLIDWRIGPESAMPEVVRAVICALRRADPNYPVETIVAHVAKHHDYTVSGRTVRRLLKEAGLARRQGPPPGVAVGGKRRLELAGMKLVEAALEDTGYLDAFTNALQEHLVDLKRPEVPRPPDTADRDAHGRFLPTYNKRYEKGPDDPIGPGFASVESKREGMDPDRLAVSQASAVVLTRKLQAVLVSPLLGSGRWDGIRVPRGELLEELCGVAYMPATLDKFTRELKYAGVAQTLWETHARLWLARTADWGDPRRAAVVYVDNTTKPVWTQLFSQSTKVSGVGRVMPGLETSSVHSGYGVPLYQVTHSGRAPLVRAVVPLLERLEGVFGAASIGRVVVIDAEANSIPFLKKLEAAQRAWVTRLRPGWVRGKTIVSRTNWRAYREGERVRMGVADFPDPATPGAHFRMRVVEIERVSTGSVSHLGASCRLNELEWKPGDLADLYFDRWPAQEANFRAVNQATQSKQVHGYGKQLVDNVSVVTQLDALKGRLRAGSERLKRQSSSSLKRSKQVREEERLLRRRERRQGTVGRHLAGRLVAGKRVTAKTQRLVEEQQGLVEEVTRQRAKVAQRVRQHAEATARQERTQAQLARWTQQQETLESRRRIFAHDVELDSLLSVLKVGLVLLVQVVLKEYLQDARMEVATFLERVATLPGWLKSTPQLEIVTLEYNHRDPEVMGLMAACCEAINDRGLRLPSGKRLRLVVDPAPPRRHPLPPGSRAGSGDRFRR